MTLVGVPSAEPHFGMIMPVRLTVGLTVITSLTVAMFPPLLSPVPALKGFVPPWVRRSANPR